MGEQQTLAKIALDPPQACDCYALHTSLSLMEFIPVRFEIFTAVSMKNAVF
jgi:hypothetical protein